MEIVGARKYAIDPHYDYGQTLDHNLSYVRVLQSILTQAIEDAITEPMESEIKFDATQWLCEEDNKLLQLCLFVAKMDHDRVLRKVARQGWNLDL